MMDRHHQDTQHVASVSTSSLASTHSREDLCENAESNDGFATDDAANNPAFAASSQLTDINAKYTYPTVCSYCRKLWDASGSTDLVSPCGCPGTKLHVHRSCLKSWLRTSGKVRCETCGTDYSNQRVKRKMADIRAQRINLWILMIMMPVGVVLTVTTCLLIDSISEARRVAAETGIPALNGIGLGLGSFVFLMILMGGIILASCIMTKSICGGGKKMNIDEMALSPI